MTRIIILALLPIILAVIFAVSTCYLCNNGFNFISFRSKVGVAEAEFRAERESPPQQRSRP